MKRQILRRRAELDPGWPSVSPCGLGNQVTRILRGIPVIFSRSLIWTNLAENSPARSAGYPARNDEKSRKGRLKVIQDPGLHPGEFSAVPAGLACLLNLYPALRAGLLSAVPTGLNRRVVGCHTRSKARRILIHPPDRIPGLAQLWFCSRCCPNKLIDRG